MSAVTQILADRSRIYPGAVFAFDFGADLGWSARRVDGTITYGMQKFPKHPKGVGRRWLNFSAWLTDQKQTFGGEVAAVFYERIDFASFTEAARTAFGFEAILTRWCEAMSIPYKGYPVGTLKKSVTGHGHAKKDQVMAALNELGYPVYDHNAADALACLLHGIKTEGLG